LAEFFLEKNLSLLSLKQELIAQIVIYLIIKCMDALFSTVAQQQKQVERALILKTQ